MVHINPLDLTPELLYLYTENQDKLSRLIFIKKVSNGYFGNWTQFVFDVCYEDRKHTVWVFVYRQNEYKLAFDACPKIYELPNLTRKQFTQKAVKTFLEIVGVGVQERNEWDTYYPQWIHT